MLGLNSRTGQPLSGIDHLRQSIGDILTTRIGARVMRRDYGSLLPGLVDRPMTPRLAMDLSFEAIFSEARAEFQARYPDYSALLASDPAIKWVDHEFPRLRFLIREEQSVQRHTSRPNPKRMGRIVAAEKDKIGFSRQDKRSNKVAVRGAKKEQAR